MVTKGDAGVEAFYCAGCGSNSTLYMTDVKGGQQTPTGLRVGFCPECSCFSVWDGDKQVHWGRRSPPKPYRIPRDQVADGIVLCGVKVTQLLKDVETLCHAGGNEATTAFLYTVALEEFGKALLLRDLFIRETTNPIIDVPRRYFLGRSAHRSKLEKAKKELPDSCIRFTGQKVTRDKKVPRIQSIAGECSEVMKRVVDTSTTALGIPNQPSSYDMRRHSYIMATEDAEKLGGDIGPVAGMAYYDEQTRYRKMYVDWDEANGCWNTLDAIGPLRIALLGGNPEFDVEVDRGELERYPKELINAVSMFRTYLDKSGILTRPPKTAGAVWNDS